MEMFRRISSILLLAALLTSVLAIPNMTQGQEDEVELEECKNVNLYVDKVEEAPNLESTIPGATVVVGNFSTETPKKSTPDEAKVYATTPDKDYAIGNWYLPPVEKDLRINGKIRFEVWLVSKDTVALDVIINFDVQVWHGEDKTTVAGGSASNGRLGKNQEYALVGETDQVVETVVPEGGQIFVLLFCSGKGNLFFLYNSTVCPSHLTLPCQSVTVDMVIERSDNSISLTGNVTDTFGPTDISILWLSIVGPDGLAVNETIDFAPNSTCEVLWEWTFGDNPPGEYIISLSVMDRSSNVWEKSDNFYIASKPTDLERVLSTWIPIGGGILALVVTVSGGKRALILIRKRRDLAFVEDVFIIYNDGRLIAHSTKRFKPVADDQVVGSMLTALRDFVKYSLKSDAGELDELTYGDLRILIERHPEFYMACVLRGGRMPKDMRVHMRNAIKNIDKRYSEALKEWDGNYQRLKDIKFIADKMVIHDSR
ncbi:MAG: hypothetical protein KAT70_08620 [Thermoplasmata archaeon]|nr:hypothetical protein [Thermoplasmata archaeon]